MAFRFSVVHVRDASDGMRMALEQTTRLSSTGGFLLTCALTDFKCGLVQFYTESTARRTAT